MRAVEKESKQKQLIFEKQESCCKGTGGRWSLRSWSCWSVINNGWILLYFQIQITEKYYTMMWYTVFSVLNLIFSLETLWEHLFLFCKELPPSLFHPGATQIKVTLLLLQGESDVRVALFTKSDRRHISSWALNEKMQILFWIRFMKWKTTTYHGRYN